MREPASTAARLAIALAIVPGLFFGDGGLACVLGGPWLDGRSLGDWRKLARIPAGIIASVTEDAR